MNLQFVFFCKIVKPVSSSGHCTARLCLLTWSTVLPLSGLRFSPGPGTEQALRTGWVMKPDSLYLKGNRLSPLAPTQHPGADSKWPGHKEEGL